MFACVRKPLKYNRVFCIGNLNRKLVLEYSVPTLKIPSKKRVSEIVKECLHLKGMTSFTAKTRSDNGKYSA